MPISVNIHRPVSRRGQWRDSYIIVIDNTPFDIGAAVFRMDVRLRDERGGACDYGHAFRASDARPALSAATDDLTNRLTVATVPSGLAIAWLFPLAQMSGLRAGSYEASICAAVGDEDAELALVNFVVR